MTSQPGAGGDAVVADAREYVLSYAHVHDMAATNVLRFARHIVKWSDTVAAAVALNALHSTTGIKTTIAPMPGGTECYCRVCEAVRSALTHRDEKEGG